MGNGILLWQEPSAPAVFWTLWVLPKRTAMSQRVQACNIGHGKYRLPLTEILILRPGDQNLTLLAYFASLWFRTEIVMCLQRLSYYFITVTVVEGPEKEGERQFGCVRRDKGTAYKSDLKITHYGHEFCYCIVIHCSVEQDRLCTCNVTLRRVRATIVAMEKQ